MKSVMLVSIVVAMLSTSGCAALFNGTSTMLHVRSEVEGAKIYFDDEYMGVQDVVVKVSKKDTPIFRAKKDGCTDGVSPAERRFDAVTLLGLFIDFGIVSILVVDWAATGAVRDFARTTYIVNPHCPGSGE